MIDRSGARAWRIVQKIVKNAFDISVLPFNALLGLCSYRNEQCAGDLGVKKDVYVVYIHSFVIHLMYIMQPEPYYSSLTGYSRFVITFLLFLALFVRLHLTRVCKESLSQSAGQRPHKKQKLATSLWPKAQSEMSLKKQRETAL